jgi:hypothetical protein
MKKTETKKTEKKNGHARKAPREKKVAEFLQHLPVALSDRELLDFGQRLAKCQADLAEHNLHAEQVKKDLKAKESAIEAERARLSGIIREKKEIRDVQCERWHFYDRGEVEEVRSDTGEVIYTRRMEMHERQVKLPGVVDDKPAGTGLPLVKPVDAQDIASSAAPGRSGANQVGTAEVSDEEMADILSHHPDEPPHELRK